MVEHQRGKELVPHGQLDDLILLIHQGMQGWVAEDGAGGSAAQRAYVHNRVRRGARDAWETEQWRAAAAGAVHISGTHADGCSRWKQTLTEMVLSGCRLQQIGKEVCKAGRAAFWMRLKDLRILGKVFGALRRALLEASTGRLTALREIRVAREHIAGLVGMDGFARRRLTRAAEELQGALVGEQVANQPGAWLLLRTWVAWRLVLATGGGRSGRSILRVVQGVTTSRSASFMRRSESTASAIHRLCRWRISARLGVGRGDGGCSWGAGERSVRAPQDLHGLAEVD